MPALPRLGNEREHERCLPVGGVRGGHDVRLLPFLGVNGQGRAGLLTPVLVRMLEGRVGSTAMMQLLASSPEVALDRAYPFHNSYLTYFVHLTGLVSGQQPTDQGIVELVYQGDRRLGPLPFQAGIVDAQEMASRSLSAIWATFSQQVLERSDTTERFYAEKYWGSLEPLLAAGLRPIVIELVRDPRDVIPSIRAYNHRYSDRFFGRPLASDDFHHLKHLVVGMALRFNEFKATLPVPTLKVRYEDFVTDPEAYASKLEDLLGTTLDPGALVADKAVLDQHMTSATVRQSIGRWQGDLSPEEVSFIETRLGANMREFGYLS